MSSEDKTLLVPYIVWESDRARAERTAKRLITVIILLIILFVGSNAFWIYEWTRYDFSSETTTETVSVESDDGHANYIGNDEEINNGTNYGQENESNTNTDTQE